MLQWWQSRGCTAWMAAKGCIVLQLWQLRGCNAQVAAKGCAVLQWWLLGGYTALVAVKGCTDAIRTETRGRRPNLTSYRCPGTGGSDMGPTGLPYPW